MIYLEMNGDKVVAVKEERASAADKCRIDWKGMEEVEALAAQASELTGDLYIGVDSGNGVYPRFDIIKAPAIGDDVSYGFNGDYYPCGKIEAISASLRRIQTSDGSTFYRRKQSAAWVKDGIWSMVPGVIDRRNPSF